MKNCYKVGRNVVAKSDSFLAKKVVTKWDGRCYKVDSFFVTKWDGSCYKVGLVLQSETGVVTKSL